MMEETDDVGVTFPIEIYEHIFSFLDGYTLLQTEKVCSQWKEIVKWLGKKSPIWANACKYDMSKKVFLAMSQKINCEQKDKFEVLYRNWNSWQHVSNYDFTTVDSKSDRFVNNVTCAKISGNHIVYGTMRGTVGVFLDTFEFQEVYEPNSKAMVNDMFFMNPKEINMGESYYQHSHLLVVYDYEFKLLALAPKLTEITCLALRKSKIRQVYYYCGVFVFGSIIGVIKLEVNGNFSVYENQICISDANGYLEVFEIDFGATLPEDLLVPVTSFRLYRPMVAEYIHAFDRVVTVITKSKIFKLDYNAGAPKWKIETGQLLPFPAGSVDRYWTFYHEVVFANGYADLHVVTIRGDKSEVVSHTFNWMECLGAPICEIYYYGNMLFVTTLAGQIYIYAIKDWSAFHLKKHDFKLSFNNSPVLTLDFQEMKDEHRLVVAMNECILQVFLYPKQATLAQL